MTTPITMDREWQTRDGREVRLFTVEGRCEYPVVGEILTDNYWHVETWKSDGKHSVMASMVVGTDLIPKPVRHKQTFWMNLPNQMNCVTGYPTKEDADKWAYPTRIACIKVDLEFSDGEGIT